MFRGIDGMKLQAAARSWKEFLRPLLSRMQITETRGIIPPKV